MNIFETAENASQAKNVARQTFASVPSKVPFFSGLYRSEKKGQGHVAGTFILSYITCLTQSIVNAENSKRTRIEDSRARVLARLDEQLKKSKTKSFKDFVAYYKGLDTRPVRNTTFLCEAVASQEGFALEDYSQGSTKGQARFYSHLKALIGKQGLPITINKQTGEIVGITPTIINAVLTAY